MPQEPDTTRRLEDMAFGYAQSIRLVSDRGPSAIYNNVLEAVRKAAAIEREACCRAVCAGCANDWPMDDELEMHIIPESHRLPAIQGAEGTHAACEAFAIRARSKEQSNAPDGA